jgi:phospholipase D1/2
MASPEKPASVNSAASQPSRLTHKLRSKVDHLASDLSRIGVAISTTWNPNHRHDEAWEQEIDAKLMAVRDSHRFRSFAPDRDGNVVKWHIDGHGELSG